MLVFLNENEELRHKTFQIPSTLMSHLQSVLKNYDGDKTISGWKRLNHLVSNSNLSYSEMKRIKNYFDTYAGTPKSAEFMLNGGEGMKNWVNNTLLSATKAVKDFKETKRKMGYSNAFIRQHKKDKGGKAHKAKNESRSIVLTQEQMDSLCEHLSKHNTI